MKEKQPKLTDEFLKAHGFEVFAQSRSARYALEKDWSKSDDNYNSKFSSGDKTKSDVLVGQYRLFIPKTFNTLQRMIADVLDAIFFDPEEIVDVRNAKVPEEIKAALKNLLTWRLNGHPVDFYKEVYEAVEDGLKFGAGVLKVYPKLKIKGKTVENVEEGGEEDGESSNSGNIEAFEPRIECVPVDDVFLDPNATWKDYWQFPIVHRMVKTKDELRAAGYKNVDDAPEIGTGSDLMASPFSGSDTQPLIRRTYLYEIWTFLDLGEGLTSAVYRMMGDAEGPSILADEPEENELPFKYSEFDPPMAPFVLGVPIPAGHQAFGHMLPIVTDALQKETNILRNQDREASALAIRKPLLYRRDAGLDVMGLINRKLGGVVPGDDISGDAVRELQASNPTINTAQVNARIDMDYYEATSITPNQLGISQRDETATAVATNQANANKKIQLIVKNLVQTLIRPALWMLLRLEQAYENDGTIQAVTGLRLGFNLPNDGAPLWSQIQGDFEFNVDVGVNKASQMNKFLLILDRINQTNVATMQLIQSGVMPPDQAKFMNPVWAFQRMMGVLRLKADDALITAQAPAPAEGGEVTTPGSQPRNPTAPDSTVSNMNPEAINEIFQ